MISVCTEMVLLIPYWVSWTPVFNWFPVLCVTPSLFISVVPWIWSLWMTKPYVLSVPQFLFSDHRCFFLLRSYSGALTSTDPANAFRSFTPWCSFFLLLTKLKLFVEIYNYSFAYTIDFLNFSCHWHYLGAV